MFRCRQILFTAFLLLPLPAVAQQKAAPASGSEEQKKPRASRVITNDDIPEKPEVVDYPSLGVRFGVPAEWDKLRPEGNAVRAACPGYANQEHDPKEQEKDRCGLYVASDGYPSCCRDDARLGLLHLRELFRERGHEVAEWKEFTVGDLAAGEHTVDLAPPRPPRRVRIIYIAAPQRDAVYVLGLIAEPEVFDKFAPVLDVILTSFELINKK